MILLLTLTAHADGFGSAQLIAGSPDDDSFTGCLASDGCRDSFLRFLGESMMEQGFTMQSHPLILTPLVSGRLGTAVGGSLSTFPFEPPAVNLSGKEENTQFSPVFPRISAGRIAEIGTHRVGMGFSALPPIPVGGARALELGMEGAVVDQLGWGVELDLMFLQAHAPITATQEQLDDRDSFSNSDNLDPELYEERCGASGCTDVFTMSSMGLRGGRVWHLPSGLSPYAKAGVSLLYERLYVMYDETTWGLLAVQPSLHGGTGFQLGESVHLAAGASAALQQPNQSESGTIGVFYKLEGAAAWIF